MERAEFDRFADEYTAKHAENIRLSGESPEYFAKYKIDEIQRIWLANGWAAPHAVLDFGSGIGSSLPHLASAFPSAALTALDVSPKSLAIAKARFPDKADFKLYGGEELPAEISELDLVFSACVFHHIPPDEHIGILEQLRRRLKPGGRIIIFEHNPLNPVTRYIVATCEFDENAVLIRASLLKARLKAAGFTKVSAAYVGFLPNALAPLRKFEPMLRNIPLGAQYYTLAHA